MAERIRPRRPDVRRDLVRAAREEFLRVGYAQSSLRRIAQAAGYTKGAVYSNFASKQELLVEVLSADLHVVTSQFRADDLPTNPTWDELSAAIVELVISEVTSNMQMLRLGTEFALEASRDPELHDTYRLLRARQKEAVLDAIGPRLVRAVMPESVDVDTVYEGVMPLITGFVVERGVLGDDLTPDAMRAVLSAQLRAVPARAH